MNDQHVLASVLKNLNPEIKQTVNIKFRFNLRVSTLSVRSFRSVIIDAVALIVALLCGDLALSYDWGGVLFYICLISGAVCIGLLPTAILNLIKICILWNAYKNNSFNDVINAFSLYIKIDRSIFTPKIVVQIKKLSDKLFDNLSQSELTKSKIDQFNDILHEDEFTELRDTLFGNDFNITVFTEEDKESLCTAVAQLDWQTSFKLFNEVFTQDSKYLTVHQAKGLEWKKVIVSVTPSTRNDKTTLSKLFETPNVLNESPEDEFTRIYYVACSRAIEDLYIHITDPAFSEQNLSTVLEKFQHKSGLDIGYGILS